MKKLLLRIVSVLGIVPLLLTTAPYTFAQDGQQVGSGLQISPTRHEITVDPGTQQSITISLKNVTTSDAIAKVVVNSFTSDNQTGEPRINANEEDNNPTSIKPFIEKIEDVPLAAGESKDINVNFNVPASAAPGGYYGVIRYQAVPVGSDEQGQISLSASVGAIVLLDVPGNVTKKMSLSSLKVGKGDLKNPTTIVYSKFLTSAPNAISLEVENNGNTFIKPFGAVTITDSSDKEVYRYEVNSSISPGNVLPNSSRIFTNELKNVSKFGRYTATANIGYEQGGEVLTIKNTFWVVPLWALILIGVVILLIAGIIFYLWRKIRPKRVKRHQS